MRKWGSTKRQFTATLWDDATDETFKMAVFTAQGAEIAVVIQEYIAALLEGAAEGVRIRRT